MSRSRLAPRSPFAQPSPFDFGPSTWGATGSPYDFGANPHGDPASTYAPTDTAERIERRRGTLRGY